MASPIRELRAVFTASAKGMTKALKEIRTEASRIGPDTARATQEASSSYNDLARTTSRLRDALNEVNDSTAFNELTGAIDRVEREIGTMGSASAEAMQELEQAVRNGGSQFDTMSTDARRSLSLIEASIEDLGRELQTVGNDSGLDTLQTDAQSAAAEVDDITEAFNDMGQEGASASDAASTGLSGLTKVATGVTAGFAAAIGSAALLIKGADDLKRATNNLQVQTGATTEEMEGMRESLVNIYGNNFGEDFNDIAASMAQVENATLLTGEMLEDATESSLLLRDSFGWEVPDTMNAVRSMMVNFGYEAEEAMNILAQGQQNGINGADDMLDVFNEFSGAFNDLGFNGEDAMNMISSAIDNGAKDASIAADSVNEFATLIRDGSDATKEALTDAGLDANAILKEFDKGGPAAAAAFQKVTEAVGGIGSKAKQEQVAVSLFGSMAEDAGVQAVLALGDAGSAIDGTKDTLSEINEIKYDSIGEAISGMGRRFVADVLIPLQDKVMPYVNKAFTGITDSIAAAKAGLKPFGDAFKTLGDVVRGLLTDDGEKGRDLLKTLGFSEEMIMRLDGYAASFAGFRGKITNFINGIKGLFKDDGAEGRDLLAQVGLPADLITEMDSFALNFSAFKNNIGGTFKGMLALFQGNKSEGYSILDSLGFSPDFILKIDGFIAKVKTIATQVSAAAGAIAAGVAEYGPQIFNTIKKFLIDIWPSVKTAVSGIASFIGSTVSKIAQFWAENGTQIMEAVSNAFNGIMAVIKFVMPVVLAIIKSIWGNIKGVITGALDVIMGLVKVFSGLFTGDFAKMWEGLKQMFFGAIRFIWNFIQLTFFGKILGGAKAFFLAFRGGFATLWTGIKTLFTGGIGAAWQTIKAGWAQISGATKTVFNGIWNFLKGTFNAIKNIIVFAVKGYFNIIRGGWTLIFNTTKNIFMTVFNFLKGIFVSIRNSISGSVSNILTKVRDTWNALKTNTSGAFRDIFNGIKSKFTDIVNLAKGLPKRIGDGIGAMASKVGSGVTKVINKLASTLGKGVNGVIGGINWVLGKVGVDKDIPKWEVPQYAKGTKGTHPGGPMIVGDGKGRNSGPEMIELPDGTQALSPSKTTLTTAPKGTKVWSATDTRAILEMVPHYAWGSEKLKAAGNWVSDKYNSGKEKVKAIGGKIKDVALNVFDYVKNPSGLLDLALKTLGIEKPKGGSFVGDMAQGGWNTVKKGALDYVKNKLNTFGATQSGIALTGGSGGGFGAPFRFTSGPGPRNTGIPGASTIHKGWDWAAPIGTPIPSVTDGTGYRIGFHPLSGNFVEVKDGSGLIHRYQHNSKNIMRVGQTVKKGQTIALVGDTGVGSGAHVHYEKRQGYERGGMITSEHTATVGEGGKKEVIIPLEQHRSRALSLWQQAGSELGITGGTTAIMYNEQQEVVNALKNVIASLAFQTAETVRQSPMLLGIKNAIGLIVPSIKTQVANSAAATNAKIASGTASMKAAVSSVKSLTLNSKAAVLKSTFTGNKQTQMEAVSVRSRIGEAVAKIREVVISMGNSVLKVAKQSLHKAASTTANKATPVKKRVVSQAEKNYFQFIREDGDWLNDWATEVPKERRKSLYIEGYNYAKSLGKNLGKYAEMHLERIRGYEDGGIVNGKMGAQLAWLTEGGWSESVISHDPSKRTSQKAIWEQTGKELGFDTSDTAVLEALDRIRLAIEDGHVIEMSGAAVGRSIAPHVSRLQQRKTGIENLYKTT